MAPRAAKYGGCVSAYAGWKGHQERKGGIGGVAAGAAAARPERPAVVELVLRPGPWGGRGVLGCHVVPVRVMEEGFVPQVATAAARHGQGE